VNPAEKPWRVPVPIPVSTTPKSGLTTAPVITKKKPMVIILLKVCIVKRKDKQPESI
jgi:hypothetical protein